MMWHLRPAGEGCSFLSYIWGKEKTLHVNVGMRQNESPGALWGARVITPFPLSWEDPQIGQHLFGRSYPLLFVVVRPPFLVPFSFVCPLVLSFSVWFLYRLLRFYFRFPDFPWWRNLLLSVISSRRYTPPLLASLKYAYSPCVLSSFLSCLGCWCWLIFIFSFLPSLFRLRFEQHLFSSCLFLVGTMLSPPFRFLLRLV